MSEPLQTVLTGTLMQIGRTPDGGLNASLLIIRVSQLDGSRMYHIPCDDQTARKFAAYLYENITITVAVAEAPKP